MRTHRLAACALLLLATALPAAGQEMGPRARRRAAQDRAGGLPPKVLEKQAQSAPELPAIERALRDAWAAADEAVLSHLDPLFHADGRRLVVPRDHATIQAAVDAASAGDVVVVLPGTYHELITMKDGVKLTSDTGGDGDERVALEGATLRLPRRTLRTVIDGSGTEPSHHGLIDFDAGLGRHTVVDGFTLQNLPRQNHHLPGHAHAVNVRGASPVIRNCLIQDNGSTGIGNHVVYRDQEAPLERRDFRAANVAHASEAVIHRNVLRRNLGLGIGCNHLSAPLVLGNEVMENDDSALGDDPSPGVGGKHGARPTLVGNHVHHNPGGGMLFRVGDPQGRHPIDVPTRPVLHGNVVSRNGDAKPGISCAGAGTEKDPVLVADNIIYGAGGAGIGLQQGTFARVERNRVRRPGRAGIAVRGSTVLVLDGNCVRDVPDGASGFAIVQESRVLRMRDNGVAKCAGPRFVVRDSEVEGERSVGTRER